MNMIIASLARLYSRFLLLYPSRFRDDFAAEMESVFRDSLEEAAKNGIPSVVIVSLRELSSLPFNILREFWHEFKGKGMHMVANEKVNRVSSIDEGAGVSDALIGVLPFLLFGIASMLVRSELLFPYPYYYLNYAYADLVLYVIALIGLLWGLIRGVPRWTFSYLGWSIFLAWSWMGRSVDNFSYFPSKHSQAFGWWSWLPPLIIIGLALALTRSLRPLRQLVRDVWQDWTRLSLATYAFIGFLALAAGYDENHHPYLFALMTATTVALCGAVWFFMRSTTTKKKSMALITGTAVAYAIIRISDVTWNWWGYYGRPAPAPEPWYFEAYRLFFLIPVLALIIFWPILIGFVRKSIQDEEPPRLTS